MPATLAAALRDPATRRPLAPPPGSEPAFDRPATRLDLGAGPPEAVPALGSAAPGRHVPLAEPIELRPPASSEPAPPSLADGLEPEERPAFEAVRRAFAARLAPLDGGERLLVDAIAACHFRRARLDAIEARLTRALLDGRPAEGLPTLPALARVRAALAKEQDKLQGDLARLYELRPRPIRRPGLNPERLRWLAERIEAGDLRPWAAAEPAPDLPAEPAGGPPSAPTEVAPAPPEHAAPECSSGGNPAASPEPLDRPVRAAARPPSAADRPAATAAPAAAAVEARQVPPASRPAAASPPASSAAPRAASSPPATAAPSRQAPPEPRPAAPPTRVEIRPAAPVHPSPRGEGARPVSPSATVPSSQRASTETGSSR